jgi:hypothetical protein
MTPDAAAREEGFRAAAHAYFAYGVVYWVGGAYLAFHGVGTRSGEAVVWRGVLFVVIGLVPLFAIPYLLRERRRWFERWILSRRDFARVLTLFLCYRAIEVARVAARAETASVPAPWGGVITYRAGALVFLAVTIVAIALVGRAAWRQTRP